MRGRVPLVVRGSGVPRLVSRGNGWRVFGRLRRSRGPVGGVRDRRRRCAHPRPGRRFEHVVDRSSVPTC